MNFGQYLCYFLLLRSVSSWANRPTSFRKDVRSAVRQKRKHSSIINCLHSSLGSNVELIEPNSGCQVVLVGCFHGSQSSAKDVEAALSEQTDVIVLELCASRFADLRRGETNNKNEAATMRPWIERFGTMVTKTFAKRGLSTAAAAAVLGGVGGLQSSLSGLEPGLEFTTALRLASNNSDIVLADQNVDDILNRLGNLPETSISLWKDILKVKNWEQSRFADETLSLKTALFGDAKMKQYVTLPRFLTRNEAAVRDLLRLFVPPLIMLEFINLTLGYFVETLLDIPPSMESNIVSENTSEVMTSIFEQLVSFPVLANLAFLLFVYLSVALPATQIILSDRDDQLAAGIRSACKLATEKNQGTGRVVAVLGFLHVNGVARRLTEPTVTRK